MRRMTAYQSALLTTPLLLLTFLSRVILPHFIFVIVLLFGIGAVIFMTWRSWFDANQGGLSRYFVGFAGIGAIADVWVDQE